MMRTRLALVLGMVGNTGNRAILLGNGGRRRKDRADDGGGALSSMGPFVVFRALHEGSEI